MIVYLVRSVCLAHYLVVIILFLFCFLCFLFFFFFFNDTATTEIYTLSLHDALPIFNVRSVKLSCIHIVHPDGRIIPFDTFNMFYREGSCGYNLVHDREKHANREEVIEIK